MTTRAAAPPPPRDLRWSEEARLRAIDAAAFWEGRVNRADLIGRFGISVPQATNDLREYQARAPANLRYDAREKAYLAEAGFEPLFGTPSAEAWLDAGENGVGAAMPVARTPVPVRRIDPWTLRKLLMVRRAGTAVRVFYQPMDQPEPSWRWVSPMALGGDGFRWHLRAWNHDSGRHEDLLFPRMLKLGRERPSEPAPVDEDWERQVIVRLRPAQKLSDGQRKVVEADYAMKDGEARLEVRAALLFLFLRRMGLDRGDGSIEVANRGELDAEIAKIRSRFSEASADPLEQ